MAACRYFTGERSERVRYKIEHENINSISTLTHVSLFLTQFTFIPMISPRTDASVTVFAKSCLACRITGAWVAQTGVLKFEDVIIAKKGHIYFRLDLVKKKQKKQKK